MSVLIRRSARAPLLLSLAGPLALVPAAGVWTAPRLTEDRIWGAFLVRFPCFVFWPDEAPPGAFTAGVVGERDLVDLLDPVAPIDRVRGKRTAQAFLERNPVRLAINAHEVEPARLRASSRLVALARPSKGGNG